MSRFTLSNLCVLAGLVGACTATSQTDPTADPTTDPTADPTTDPSADPPAGPTTGPTTVAQRRAAAGEHFFATALPHTNGRACATCHAEADHLALTPRHGP